MRVTLCITSKEFPFLPELANVLAFLVVHSQCPPSSKTAMVKSTAARIAAFVAPATTSHFNGYHASSVTEQKLQSTLARPRLRHGKGHPDSESMMSDNIEVRCS